MTVKIQARRDTAANWTSANPILSSGEPGFEVDTNKLKIGDGSTAWNSLNYIGGGDAAGANTQIQFNTAGQFDASANLTYDGALNVKGTGTTSATQALKLSNSVATNLLTMNDDGTFNGKNIALGEYAGAARIGENAGINATGSNWAAIGVNAGNSNTTGNLWTAIGARAGQSNTTGSFWTAIGADAAPNNTTGLSFTAIGNNAGLNNTTGSFFIAIGSNAGLGNTTGSTWTAIGNSAGRSNTTGSGWIAIGVNAANSNTTGSNWAAIGANAGLHNLTGGTWVAIGQNAGRFIKGTSTALEYFQNSTYLGSLTKGTNGTDVSLTNNETVIGYAAEGNGSNTVTIGSSAVTDNYFTGDIHAQGSGKGIIVTSPNGSVTRRIGIDNSGNLVITTP